MISVISVSLNNDTVYIMDDDENISQATSGCIICNNKSLDFIEQNGKYAYTEFFREGDWPDKYYDEDELSSNYQGIRLKMISGGWCENFSNLIQTIPHHEIYKVFDKISEKENTLLSFFTRLKNGEGVRGFESIRLNEGEYEGHEEYERYEGNEGNEEYDPEIDADGDNPWD
jgi:hypothetical protein